MTILKFAINSYQALNNLLFTTNSYKGVEHLSDDLLRDVGLYREGGFIRPCNSDYPAQDKAADEAPESVIFIPNYLKDSGG